LTGKEIRLSKFFPEKSNAVIVAIDHGQTFGAMEGLVDYAAAAQKIKSADGILLAAQMVRFADPVFRGQGSPAMIVRLNWNTIHCEPWHYREAQIVKTLSVATAVHVGADAVLASLTLHTGSEKQDAENTRQFAEIAEEAYKLGIPLIGEVFHSGDLRSRPAEFHDYIKKMCRIICELGADAIKTFYTGEQFAEATAGVPIPVFALGAEKLASELDALDLAYKAVRAGARGVVYGRNVVQANDPAQFLQKLKIVAQGNVKPQDVVIS
jgi:DhnA family fructose-bisphosphate aldolase class Ia